MNNDNQEKPNTYEAKANPSGSLRNPATIYNVCYSCGYGPLQVFALMSAVNVLQSQAHVLDGEYWKIYDGSLDQDSEQQCDDIANCIDDLVNRKGCLIEKLEELQDVAKERNAELSNARRKLPHKCSTQVKKGGRYC